MLKYIPFLLISCQLMAMENAQIIIVTDDNIDNKVIDTAVISDIKQWVLKELDDREARLKDHTKAIQSDLESHKQDVQSSYNKTKIALITTIVTTVGGVATVLITYLTTHYVHNGSN